MPQSWIEDRERCQRAGIPDEVTFASKPELARRMLERALGHGVSAAWVTAGSGYGSRNLRFLLEQWKQPFVLEVACKAPMVEKFPHDPSQ